MNQFTVMVVGDERSPVRRFQVSRRRIQHALLAAALVAAMLLAGTWDYWRLRAGAGELATLRVETQEQREQLDAIQESLVSAKAELERVRELERKVRIIANLPGAAGVGGSLVTELAPPGDGDAQGEILPPAGVPVVPMGEEPQGAETSEEDGEPVAGLTTPGARKARALGEGAGRVEELADRRASSLDDLLALLEDKRNRLASMPSIWPTRGWLTSRYGNRVSPFTGKRHKHTGIDVAAAVGTPIVAPGRGRVVYTGTKGPLGKTVILDHGFGVRTIYGHSSKINVKVGDRVERGDLLAAVGNTGRSTGPHLHYSVEAHGKSRDPLDYIFD